MFSVAVLLLLAAGSCVNSIDLIQTDSMVVQSGQSLIINCQVSGYSLTDNSYATGWIRQSEGKPMDWISHRWGGGDFYQNNALKNKFLYHTHTSTSSVTLTGKNLQPEDTAVYYCVRVGDYNHLHAFDYWGKGTMVTVTSATSTAPTVFPLMQCGSGTGDMVTLGCLATGFTPSSVTYAWNKVNGAALTDFIQYPPVQKNNVYTGVSQIRVRRQDWDARETFKCAVTHASGQPKECIFQKPVVPCNPPTLSVLASSDVGDKASFSCFAKDFSPKDYEIKWLKNEEEIVNKIDEIQTRFEGRKYNNGTTLYRAASFLTVESKLLENTEFTCELKVKSGGCLTLNSSVIYKPIPSPSGSEVCLEADVEVDIIEPKMEDMFSREGKGNITCQVKINKPSVTEISWETHNGRTILHPSVFPTEGQTGVVSALLPITYDEWSQGTKFVCKVEHSEWIVPLKKTYGRTVGGKIQRPSVFMLPPLEHTQKKMVTLTCFVKDFFPREVLVSWLVDDEEAGSKFQFHTTNPVENHGSYSAYGQLSLTLEQWQNSDMVYSCVVHHESVVNTSKAIVRSIGHRTFEKTNLVNLNMNIPETCNAQ